MSENVISNDANPESDSGHGDQGHDTHEAHPKPKYDDVNIPVVVLIGIFSAILTFVAIAFVQGLYFNWTYSMVQADWNNRSLSPQEQSIVDQKAIRNGFYETKEGKIYVSAEVAARKMIGSTPAKDSPKSDSPKSDSPKKSDSKQPEKKVDSKPQPPGPDAGGKAKQSKADPKKDEASPKSDQKKDPDPKAPVKNGKAKTGDKK